MSALSEFERDLLRERVHSGIAAASRRDVVFGRRLGQRIKADRCTPKILQLVGAGQSYREISHRLGISKNTVLDILKRHRAPARLQPAVVTTQQWAKSLFEYPFLRRRPICLYSWPGSAGAIRRCGTTLRS